MNARQTEQKRGFPSTHWSQIYLARDREREEGAKALGELVQNYRLPLETHLEHRFRIDGRQSAEWLDAFVEKRVLGNDLLRAADQSNGKFRGYLVKCLDRFVVDLIRRENRRMRKPEGGFRSLEGLEENHSPTCNPQEIDPGDRLWALQVIDQAREQAESFYRRKETTSTWEIFLHGVYLPLRDGSKRPSDAELAARFGFQSPAQVSNTITTAKRKFGNCVRDVISKYVPRASPNEVDEEIRDLMALVSGDPQA